MRKSGGAARFINLGASKRLKLSVHGTRTLIGISESESE